MRSRYWLLLLALGPATALAWGDDCKLRAERAAGVDAKGVEKVILRTGAGDMKVVGRGNAVRIEAARLLVWKAADMKDKGERNAMYASMAKAFAAICGARDAAVTTIEDAARNGREVRGFEADKAARQVLIDAGYEDAILHRTGHSLGENVHGNGAHLDDYETHDERRLLPGSGFTIEPGLYFKDFGVRTEINMVWTANGPEVTGPRQKAILSLL